MEDKELIEVMQKLIWQLVAGLGIFLGLLTGLLKYVASRIIGSVDSLVDKQGQQAIDIAVEAKRNDNQDIQINKHDDEIEQLKDLAYQVKYRKA